MAQSNKVSKSKAGITPTYAYVILVLLIVIAGLLIYILVVPNSININARM